MKYQPSLWYLESQELTFHDNLRSFKLVPRLPESNRNYWTGILSNLGKSYAWIIQAHQHIKQMGGEPNNRSELSVPHNTMGWLVGWMD